MHERGWVAAEVVASRQYGVISKKQLEGTSVSRSAVQWALDHGRLVPLARGLYRFALSRVTWEQFGFGFTQLLAPGSALSHWTAGFLWGLPDCAPPRGNAFDLSVPNRTVLELPPGARLHRPRHPFTRTVLKQGMHVTQLSRTLVDLAGHVPEAHLARMLDAANKKFSSFGLWLRAELKGIEPRGREGLATLVRLLDERTGLRPIESPLETDVFRALKASSLPPPKTQVDVRDPATGAFLARVDFAWAEHLVALFADSRLFHWDREAFDRDAAQRTRLAGAGWTVIIVTRAMLDSGTWLTDLSRTLDRRAPQRPLFLLEAARRPGHGEPSRPG